MLATQKARLTLALAALLALAACGVSAKAYVGVAAPPAIETYPQVVRDGHVFYWVEDRWYVQHQGKWYAYPPAPEPRMQWGWRGSAW